MISLRLALCGLFCCEIAAGTLAAEDEPTPEQAAFFETKVRPLLSERCFGCHGPDKQKSGLRLDSRAAMLAGGDSGAAIEPGSPESSLLVDAVNYRSLEMPPDRKLSDDEIEVLTQWVKEGAPWPNSVDDNTPAIRSTEFEINDEDRHYWAFQPIRRPGIPEISSPDFHRSANPLDCFLLERLAEHDLGFSTPADARRGLRRLSFDLIGLPPSAGSVDQFAADPSPDAYERLTDRYLANPEFGERWGRHWLDLVRFAQTNGYERDDEKPHIWRYRDYVIDSLNADKPYDQFVREQLAGDELDRVTDESIIATGFYRLGVWDDEPDDGRQAEFDELDDMLSTTGSVFLGLTVGCARCHDHKFDPLSQEDYYSLLAFLRNVKRYVKPDDKAVGVTIANLQAGGQALAVFEQGTTPPTVQVLARGSAATPGKEVHPRFPLVFGSDLAAVTPELSKPSPDGKSLGRRRALAEWLTRRNHPLTARVIVNRLWHSHFGKGLVPTPSDFGHTGLPCTHPKLLDYLARELVDSGWSLKHIHRLIVTSAAYRQSSRADRPEAVAVDPANTLLWRQNLRRLEAEAIRDAMLAVSGRLNREMHGRGIFPELSPAVLSTQSMPGRGWDKSPPAQRHRRSVYIFVKRTLGVPLLESFDMASPDTSQALRNTTTIAPQALILLNSDFSGEQAQAFADRLLSLPAEDVGARIRSAFRSALARLPSDPELTFAREFLARQENYWREHPPASLVAESDASAMTFAGWTAFGGSWSSPEPGVCTVEPAPGAKIVRDDVDFADGVVECQVRLDRGGDAGLLLRVSEPRKGTDTLTGYNVNFTPTQLRLGKHANNWKELSAAAVAFPADKWTSLRVHAEGNRIRIYVDGAAEPSIDFIDSEPLPAGKLGLRTYFAKASFRDLHVMHGEMRQDLQFAEATAASQAFDGDPAERQAWAGLAKILLNLNEFVYVD
jgi:hypothetical protein